MQAVTTLIALVKDATLDLSTHQRENLARFLKNYEGRFVSLTASVKGKPRSINQNNYYHGEFVERCADHDGYTHKEMHEVLKWEFLEHKTIKRDGRIIEYAVSTTDLSTMEFTAFLDKIVAHYGERYGMRFMTPQEWYDLQCRDL